MHRDFGLTPVFRIDADHLPQFLRVILRAFINREVTGYLHRTAQTRTVASIKTWRSSGRAGRVGLTRCKGTTFFAVGKFFLEKI